MKCAGRIALVALALLSAASGIASGRVEAARQMRETRPPPSSAGPHTPVVVVRNGP